MARKLLIALAVVVGLAGLSALAFKLWFPAAKVRALITSEGSRALGVEVKVGEIHPSLFPLGMSIAGLEVANPAANAGRGVGAKGAGGALVPGAPPLLKLGAGEVRLRFLPLFARRLEVASATLRDLDLVLVLGPDGQPVLPLATNAAAGAGAAPATGSAPGGAGSPGGHAAAQSPFLLILSSFKLENGSLRVLDPSNKKETDLAGLAAEAAMQLADGGATVHITAKGSAASLRTTDLEAAGLVEGLRNLSFSGDLSMNPREGTLQITSLRAGTGSVTLNATGSVTGLPNAANVTLTIPRQSLEFASLIPLLPPVKTPDGKTATVTGSGSLGVEGEIRILAGQPPAERITIALQNVAVNTSASPVGASEGTGAVELTATTAKIQNVSYMMAGHKVNLDGTVEIAPDSITTRGFHARVGRSSLELAAKIQDPSTAKKVTFQVRGPLVDLVEFMPPPAAGGASGAGAAATGQTAAKGAPAEKPAGQKSSASTPPAAAPAAPDLSQLGKQPLIPPLPIGSATGTLDVDTLLATNVRIRRAHADLALDASGLRAKLTADSALVGGVPLTAATGQVKVAPRGTIDVEGVSARVYTGSVNGEAHVAIEGPGKASYRLNAKAENLEANDFLSNLTPMRNILYGKTGLTLDFQGSGITKEALARSINAQGQGAVTGGKLVNLPVTRKVADLLGLKDLETVNFRNLASAFQVHDGRVETRQLSVEGGDASWSAAGSVGFDGTLDYDMSLTLSKALTDRYRQKSTLADLFVSDDGRMVFDFKVGGNARDPKVSYDAKKTASRGGVKSAAAQLLQTLDKGGKAQGFLDRLKKQIPKEP